MSPSRGALKATHTFTKLLHSSLPTQIYLSRSKNPHTNLSLEHHLFTALPAETHTLLLYTNTPSLILGRNQNPWLETHHPILLRSPSVQLLRRRSGGGTVFHDLGNINYSVTVPTATFDRDRHAQLIVRALRSLGVREAVVNKRHDIVMLPRGSSPTEEKIEHEVDGARKVSGSAYKLTRLRSYHHGTMLLSSDLVSVSALLKSPVKEIINARGVASVPSPVANTGVEREAFGAAAVGEFLRMYPDEAGVTEVTEEEAVAVEAVAVGRRELESQEWVYGQTPRFTIQLPTGGEVVVDKGVVMDTLGGLEEDGIVGEKFGGEVVEKALVNGGMQNWEAREWVDSMIGGRVWGV